MEKILNIIRKMRRNKVDSESSEFNWVSDIIRQESGPRVIKSEYISPQRIKDENQYKEKLISWLKSLEEGFRKKTANSKYVDTIIEMRSAIVYILDEYHAGNIGNAYEKMKSIISDMMTESLGLAISSIQKSFSFNDLENVLNDSISKNRIEFFRARTSEKYCVFERKEMLHIPFDMRGKITSTRFSIPGLPCLYLATTSYCCWLELRTPAEYQFNVSPVKINQERKILNLTMNAEMFEHIIALKDIDKLANEYTIEALKIWILSYASSFKIDADNRSFKEEYIIPQLIMLASKDLKLDGVSYYSKQVEDDRFAYMLSVNLALFARYNGEKRFSEICRDIEISPSYNYAMFNQLGHSEKYKSNGVDLHIRNSRYPKMIGGFGRQNEYQFTKFYDFDRYLFSHIEPEIKKIDIDEENKRDNNLK